MNSFIQNSSIGDFIVTHKSSDLKMKDLKRLSNASSIKRIHREFQIPINNAHVKANFLHTLFTAYELLSKASSDMVCVYQVDGKLSSAFLSLNPNPPIGFLSLNVQIFEELFIATCLACKLSEIRTSLDALKHEHLQYVNFLSRMNMKNCLVDCEEESLLYSIENYGRLLLSASLIDIKKSLKPAW